MVVKRKRSDSEISCSSSLLSSPPNASTGINMARSWMDGAEVRSLFSSRTRKRHRDNRPSERDVHQHTLQLLYGAQQSTMKGISSGFDPVFEQDMETEELVQLPPPSTNQRSLHSFFRSLPSSSSSRPAQTRNSSASTESSMSEVHTPTEFQMAHDLGPLSGSTNCEDCNARIDGEEFAGVTQGEDVDMMDVDMSGVMAMERKCVDCQGKRWGEKPRSYIGVENLGCM